jgi:hypothetical protein
LGLCLGEGISAAIRIDPSGKENNSGLTWFLKIGVALLLMLIVLKSCS